MTTPRLSFLLLLFLPWFAASCEEPPLRSSALESRGVATDDTSAPREGSDAGPHTDADDSRSSDGTEAGDLRASESQQSESEQNSSEVAASDSRETEQDGPEASDSDTADAGNADVDDMSHGAADAGSTGASEVNESETGDSSSNPSEAVDPQTPAQGDGNGETKDPPPSIPIACEEYWPGYDCEFSRNAFRKRADDALWEQCGDCHSDAEGGVPPFLTDYVLGHDAALPYITLDDLAASPLLQMIRDGHYCEDDCYEKADRIKRGLRDWRSRFPTRERRLAELETAMARWADAGIEDYQWTIEDVCFACFDTFDNHALAVVSSEQLVSLRLGPALESPGAPVEPTFRRPWYTVAGLFETMRSAIELAVDDLTVSYDSSYWYPDSVTVDYTSEWVDDEHYYEVRDFLVLGAGYCEERGAFRSDAATLQAQPCASTQDCASCAPRQPYTVCGGLYRRCSVDADCSAGSVCVDYGREGCANFGSYCRLDCTEDPCPMGYGCDDETGHCVELECTDAPELCVDAEHCQPGSPQADRRGCVPPSCAEGAVDCGSWARCDPTSTMAMADGCAPLDCVTDDDCGCGSCVNEFCAAAPGLCLSWSSPEASPELGPPPD